MEQSPQESDFEIPPETVHSGADEASERAAPTGLDMDQPQDSTAVVRKRRGHPVIAWIVILALVVLGSGLLSPDAATDGDVEAEDTEASAYQTILELQARYFIGASKVVGADPGVFQEQIDMFNRGSYRERLCYVVLTGEMLGYEVGQKALIQLNANALAAGLELSETDRRLSRTLQQLLTQYISGQWSAETVDAESRQQLVAQLQWFGELALHPAAVESPERQQIENDAAETVSIALVGLSGLTVLFLGGLVSLFVMTALSLRGRLTSRLPWSMNGGIYAETFAVWMLLFFVLSVLVELISETSPGLFANPIQPQFAVSLLSLLAVFWPVIRGVSWSQVRLDAGLSVRGSWFKEGLFGLLCYATALPLVALGLLFVVGAGSIPMGQVSFEPTNLPAHPILIWIRQASMVERMQVFLLAAVCAPILEETMFRGFLYRHLREATAACRMSTSILFSAVFNSLIFAVIHPQGVLAIPALSAMAFGFSLAREWRGNLIAPMTAHAFNNGAVTTAMILLL